VSSRVTDCPAVQRLADGPDGKQPYFISAADGEVLSFAGLWDRWKNPETGEPMASCTIIVTDANALTRPIHNRMPGGARSGGCQAVAERRRRHRASQAGQSFLSRWGWRFEVMPPHRLEQGDRSERGHRVEASDENEHGGPAARLLL